MDQLEDRLMPGSILGLPGLPLDGWNLASATSGIALTSKLTAGTATAWEKQLRPSPQAAPPIFAAEVAARAGQAEHDRPERAGDPTQLVHRDVLGLARGVLDQGLLEDIDSLKPMSSPRHDVGWGAGNRGASEEVAPGRAELGNGAGVVAPGSGGGQVSGPALRSGDAAPAGQDWFPWNLRLGPGGQLDKTGTVAPAVGAANQTPAPPPQAVPVLPKAGSDGPGGGNQRRQGPPPMPETAVPPDAPPDSNCDDCECDCDGGGPVKKAEGEAAIPVKLAYSTAPVRYFDGTVKLSTADLKSSGFGAGWGQSRSWTNTSGYTGVVTSGGSSPGGQNGSGMVVSQLPFVLTNNDFTSAVVVLSGSSALFFDDVNGSNPTPHFFVQDKLSHPNGEFVLTTPTGDQLHFYDFTGAPSFNRWGKFKGMTDALGDVTTVTAWTSDGRQAEVQRSTPAGQSPQITESYLYSYVPSGNNAGLLANVTLRRQVNGGAWNTVRQVAYDYYTNADTFGNAGDLKTAVIQDGAGNTIDTKYYRYYKDSSGSGYTDGLKYLFNPPSFTRLQAHLVGSGYTPFTAPDNMVAAYADNYFEYDYNQRVTKEVAQGTGCSVCTGGLGAFTYSYSTSTNTPGYNSWQYKTVEVLPDNSATFVSQNIVYANFYGEVMLKVYESGAPGNTQKWETFYKYDNQGRIVLTANPSAVSGYDETKADLLNNVAGHYQYLRDNQGEINLTDYYTATTATATTPGGAAGYVKDTKVQQGQLGTPILLSSTQYYAHTGGATVDVTVVGPSGTSAVTPADQFTYVAPPAPTVTGLSPSSGSTAGGTSVTITGTNFTNASAVTFGTTSASFTVVSSTTIQATTPAHTAGTVDVTIATPGGTAATQFTYVAPAVTGLSPNSGSIAGGYTVTITGTGFTNASAVNFDGNTASFFVTSDTTIQATAPAHAAGVVDVTVSNAGDTSATNPADQFTYVVPPPPRVTGLSPNSGSIAGGYTVTVTGTNFTNASAVNFDGNSAFYTVVSATTRLYNSTARPGEEE
jgi:hypothetical protein